MISPKMLSTLDLISAHGDAGCEIGRFDVRTIGALISRDLIVVATYRDSKMIRNGEPVKRAVTVVATEAGRKIVNAENNAEAI